MFNEKLKLEGQELDNQFETIVSFLSAVHPTLDNDSDFRPCVEIRPILRNGKSVSAQSLNIWDLSDKSLIRLKQYLNKLNGMQVCLFYSVFHFDNNKEIVTNNGVRKKQRHISTHNAVGTYEIALDFDNVDYNEYMSLVDRFEEIGIFALWISSGHGYQAHIILDEELCDTQAYKNIISLFREKGFDCDPACVDSARVMRLPGTLNCKCFVDEKYGSEKDNPPRCEIVQDSLARYSYLELIEALKTIPSVSISKPAEDIPIAESISLKEKKASQIKDINYPYISKLDLPVQIIKMLTDTPYGYRNNTLGFLIRFFKTQFKLSKIQLEELLNIWGREACSPAYDHNELKKDFTRLYYKYDGLSYNSKLAAQFGNIDFSNFVTLRKKDILIPHAFSRDLNVLDGRTVRAYLALKLLEHHQEEVTQTSLAEKLNITVRALRPALQNLLKSRHAYVQKGNRRLKIPDIYHSHRIFSANDGYSIYSYNDLNAYINDFAEQNSKYNELKVYLFFRYKFYTGDIFMSQVNIGQHTGIAQNTVSDIVNRLADKKYIKIIKKYHSPAVYSLEYILLR